MSLRLLHQTPNLIHNFILGSATHLLGFSWPQRFKASLGPGNLQIKGGEAKELVPLSSSQSRRVTMGHHWAGIPPPLLPTMLLLELWEKEQVTEWLMFQNVVTLASPYKPTKYLQGSTGAGTDRCLKNYGQKKRIMKWVCRGSKSYLQPTSDYFMGSQMIITIRWSYR